jgi:hypothetical protein
MSGVLYIRLHFLAVHPEQSRRMGFFFNAVLAVKRYKGEDLGGFKNILD